MRVVAHLKPTPEPHFLTQIPDRPTSLQATLGASVADVRHFHFDEANCLLSQSLDIQRLTGAELPALTHCFTAL